MRSRLHDGIFHFLAKAEPCVEKEILRAFKVFDCDGTGKISFENLKVVASEVGEDITDEELQVCESQTHSSCPCSGREGSVLLREDRSGIVLGYFATGRISVSLGACLRPSLAFALSERPPSWIPPNLVSKSLLSHRR